MRGYPKGSTLLARGTVQSAPVQSAPVKADAVQPLCVDCDEPIAECRCDERPIGPMDAVDRFDMRVDQLYDRLVGK